MERVDKHPFQLSRVHYNGKDREEQAWVEPCDGACRWTQSAAEVTVLVRKVPLRTKRADIRVSVDIRSLRVESADGRTVYLAGTRSEAPCRDEFLFPPRLVLLVHHKNPAAPCTALKI